MDETVSGRPAGAANQERAETDAELVQGACGDQRAFGALYDRYVDVVYRYLYRQTGARDIAEDLTSVTFMRALAALDRFDPQRPVAPWLLRIAHNALVDDRRSARRTVRLSEEMVRTLVAEAEQGATPAEQAEAFLAFTAGLPDDQRDALALRFIADLTIEQTATALGRSIAATKMLLSRAYARLRTRIVSNIGGPSCG